MNLIILSRARLFPRYPRIVDHNAERGRQLQLGPCFLSAASGGRFILIPSDAPNPTSCNKHTRTERHAQLDRSTLYILISHQHPSDLLPLHLPLLILSSVSPPPTSRLCITRPTPKKTSLIHKPPLTTNTYTSCSLSVPLPGLNELWLRSPPRGVSRDLALKSTVVHPCIY